MTNMNVNPSGDPGGDDDEWVTDAGGNLVRRTAVADTARAEPGAVGDAAPEAAGGIVAGAAAGAAAGTVIGGPIGTAIGAIVGGVAGAAAGNAVHETRSGTTDARVDEGATSASVASAADDDEWTVDSGGGRVRRIRPD